MTAIPPPLSSQSADRMSRVLDDVDEDIEKNATAPNEAIAKAAAAHDLPLGQVVPVVRAFNTGRAARQLQEGRTVWEKAASYPTADVDAVLAILRRAPEPVLEKRSQDYALSPAVWAALTRVKTAAAPALPSPPAALPVSPVPSGGHTLPATRDDATPPRAFVRARVRAKAAGLLDELTVGLRKLTPGQYTAFKSAAARRAPAVAAWAVPLLETEDAWVRAAAQKAAAADPLFPDDHPTVVLAAALDRVRRAYPASVEGTAPAGYRKVAGDDLEVWYRKAPTCPIFGVPVPLQAAVVPEGPPRGVLPLDGPLAKLAADAPIPIPEGGGGEGKKKQPAQSAFGRLFGGIANTYNQNSDRFSKSLLGRVGGARGLLDVRGANHELGDAHREQYHEDQAARTLKGLHRDLSAINNQANIQRVLADPRFAQSDPRLLLESHRELSGLAPMAMANPAVASDFLNRRMQTGQLSYYDLKALTGIEYDLARIRSAHNENDEDESEAKGPPPPPK